MYRGTTPTLTFKLNTDIDLSALEEVWITIKGNDKEKTYTIDDVFVESEEKSIILSMTQTDTLYFGAGRHNVQIRLRTDDGNAYASNIKQINLDYILKDGVI